VPAAFPFHYAASRLLLERTAEGKETKKEKHNKSVEFAVRELLVLTSPRCRYQKQLQALSLVRFMFSSVFFFSALFLFFLLFSPGIAVSTGG
jgi:hypothetical protein